mmetsp:Transcript_102588/g.330882  ORF Transcript_102588/g.330882 Transcript_102588/m.330882 type:complete len:129 (-) Transcript_102588:133-519(-)
MEALTKKIAVYDKPLFADRSQAGIYKFDRERMEQNEGRLGHIGNTKSFSGAADGGGRCPLPRGGAESSSGARTAPVEFEREDSEPRESRGDRRDERRDRSRSRRRRPANEDDDEFGLGDLLEDKKRKR